MCDDVDDLIARIRAVGFGVRLDLFDADRVHAIAHRFGGDVFASATTVNGALVALIEAIEESCRTEPNTTPNSSRLLR